MMISPEQFFQALSDPTRLRSLLLIRREGELCVCELMHAMGVIQPKISRHLAILRNAGLVIDRRRGQWVYYRLSPDLPTWVSQVLDATAQEAKDLDPFAGDLKNLKSMADRPNLGC